MEIELERTFLLKKIPEKLKDCKFIEILDIYIPQSAEHPVLRLRKKGNVFEMTKKFPKINNDASEQEEHTIVLSEEEFIALSKLDGKKFRKFRYYYPIGDMTAEIDIYLDDLEGLALADFEFKSIKERNIFAMPDFCLADVIQEKVLAGGMLAGKKYSDIESTLNKYNYRKINKPAQ
ncbi:MAG: hypothetical protein PHG83_03765 [Patescibacteria group bacterium]|nr:hypothetical protein [Patescibacteria group bacterium]